MEKFGISLLTRFVVVFSVGLFGILAIEAVGKAGDIVEPAVTHDRDFSNDALFLEAIDKLAAKHVLGKYLKDRAPAALLDRNEGLSILRSEGTLGGRNGDGDCNRPTNGACVEAVCRHLPSYQCDDTSELLAIASSCRGSADGSCVESICRKIPSYQCDDSGEAMAIAQACRGAQGSCIDSAIRHLPSYQVDDSNEMISIANACRNAEGSCVESVCSRLPSYQCDDTNEFIAIARQCGGQ